MFILFDKIKIKHFLFEFFNGRSINNFSIYAEATAMTGAIPTFFLRLMEPIILLLEEAGMELCWLEKLLEVKLLDVLGTFG